MTCRNKRKWGHRQFLGRPDRSSAFRMEVMDWSLEVLDMSLGFRSFHLIELHFDDYLLQLILNRWVKLEIHSLATGNLTSFLVLELWPLVESLSMSNLVVIRSVVLRKGINQLNSIK
jgi:hypothetical protein